MKKLALTALAVIFSIGAMAQISAYKQGLSAAADGYALPRTVVQGTVAVEREVIIRGPYARFAAQYLGITGAPMNDKESYKILGAKIGWTTEPDPQMVFTIDEKSGSVAKVFTWITPEAPLSVALASDRDFEGAKLGSQVPFTDVATSTTIDNSNGSLSVDRSTAVEKSTEQMAADAAAVIFRIRKSRLDLITGETGEYVYGEGLKAALDKMDQLEAEYLSLFIGKRYVQKTEHNFSVVPEAGKTRAVAFRFSESKGFALATDLSASPYNLEFVPQSTASVPQIKKGARVVVYRIPLMEQVTLTNGTQPLASERMPIFQKGSLVESAVL